jgi:hypothetical protein
MSTVEHMRGKADRSFSAVIFAGGVGGRGEGGGREGGGTGAGRIYWKSE